MNTKFTLLLLGLIVIVFFTSCKKENEDKCKIILLKVDYMTYTFEGGHEQTLSGKLTSADTIPITIDFDPPILFQSLLILTLRETLVIFHCIIILLAN